MWLATFPPVITAFDDYPIHQTSQPITVPASGDPNHYDRYFFNGYTADGSLYFGLGMGLYPNRSVHDASFSVVRGGQQISVHASGRAPMDRSQANVVGPIEVRIVEPLRVHRVLVDAPDQGLRADLTFTARTAVLQEPPFHMRAGVKVLFDYTRLTQMGRWQGWVEVDGERIEVDPADVLGSRDRSWGIRPCGERVTVPPPAAPPQFYWLWAPLNFPDFATHFDVNEYADGARWHEYGVHLPALDDSSSGSSTEPEVARSVDYDIAWGPGTRHATAFTLRLTSGDGGVSTIVLEPMLNFQMFGIGYGHPEWSHGLWKGEAAVGGTRFAVPVDNPSAPHHIHIQALCRAVHTAPDGTESVGCGILEQLVLGAHAPTGLHGVVDGYQPG